MHIEVSHKWLSDRKIPPWQIGYMLYEKLQHGSKWHGNPLLCYFCLRNHDNIINAAGAARGSEPPTNIPGGPHHHHSHVWTTRRELSWRPAMCDSSFKAGIPKPWIQPEIAPQHQYLGHGVKLRPHVLELRRPSVRFCWIQVNGICGAFPADGLIGTCMSHCSTVESRSPTSALRPS